MVTAILLLLGVGIALGAGIMLLSLADAPEAYEDSEGFHLGQDPASGAHPVLASSLTESRNDAARAAFSQTQGQRHAPLAS